MATRIAEIDRYVTIDSPIHRLDPRIKLVVAIVFMVSCLFVESVPTLLLACVVLGAAIALSRVPLGRLLSSLKSLVILLVIASLFNLFFEDSGSVLLQVGVVTITTGGVLAAVLYTARFTLMLLAGALLMATTTSIQLADAAERLLTPLERLGVPVGQAVSALTIALRFVPTLSREAENIISAQTARGADLEGKGALAYAKACVPLMVPLLASSLRHAENLARAMDARCYTGENRTRYHEMRLDGRRDGAAVAAVAVYLVVLTALNVVGL